MSSSSNRSVATHGMQPDRAVGDSRKRGVARSGWRIETAGWLALGALAVVAAASTLAVLRGGPAPGVTAGSSAYPYVVGAPGPGAVAPPIQLTATNGTAFNLTNERGKTVLLFFQEGIGCQPCWEQLKQIEADMGAFRSKGIDEVVTVTGDPAAALRQKVSLEGLRTPVLSDPGLAVSLTYGANRYGMMGTSADGHSFIVVGPDGRIQWRADYGGPPKYTMFVPIPQLLTDMKLVSAGS